MKSALNVTKNLPEMKTSVKSTVLPELKVYDNGLSPLSMQTPYSKLILGIKSLLFKEFPKFLLHILQQIQGLISTRKYFAFSLIYENNVGECILRG